VITYDTYDLISRRSSPYDLPTQSFDIVTPGGRLGAESLVSELHFDQFDFRFRFSDVSACTRSFFSSSLL